MSFAQHVAGMGGNINAYKILVGEPEEERILGTTRYMWKDNIKKEEYKEYSEIVWAKFICVKTGISGRLL